MASNHAVLMYDIGLSAAGVQSLVPYCNGSQCQIVSFNLAVFPPHVQVKNDSASTLFKLLMDNKNFCNKVIQSQLDNK